MQAKVAERLTESAKTFVELVWPAISERAGGGKLEPVEAVTATGFKQTLDTLAGIDAWQVHGDYGVRGIASRIQPTNRCWKTFTLRYQLASGHETEFAKRLRAELSRDRGWLSPHITVQAYTTGGPLCTKRLLGVGIVKTSALVFYVNKRLDAAVKQWEAELAGEAVRSNRAAVYIQSNQEDGNLFLVAEWDAMERDGVDVKTVYP